MVTKNTFTISSDVCQFLFTLQSKMNVYATDDQLQVIGHIYVLYDTRAEDKGI